MSEQEQFEAHLRRAAEIVGTWPEWKRKVLGWPYEKPPAQSREHQGASAADIGGAAAVVEKPEANT